VQYSLNTSNTLHYEVLGGDSSGLIETTDVYSTSGRNAEWFSAEYGYKSGVS
jgi:hypothetical protein